jgi:hypothetical protein
MFCDEVISTFEVPLMDPKDRDVAVPHIGVKAQPELVEVGIGDYTHPCLLREDLECLDQPQPGN